MSIPAIQKVAINIRRYRTKLGMSASELSRRAGVSKATVTRLEGGQISNPQASNLVAIADVLSVTVGDLMGDSTRRTAASLPTLAPYLRTKYKDLPEDALQEIESHFNDLAARHGIAPSSGPAPHEDEQ